MRLLLGVCHALIDEPCIEVRRRFVARARHEQLLAQVLHLTCPFSHAAPGEYATGATRWWLISRRKPPRLLRIVLRRLPAGS
jgi:hypothetical protein